MKQIPVGYKERGGKVFLFICTPKELAHIKRYAIEREVKSDCTAESILGLIAEMARETGLNLEPSLALKEAMGI